MIDFNKLLEAPAYVILAGIAIYFILDNKKDKEYYRNESKENTKNFLEALNTVTEKNSNRMDKIEKDVSSVKEVVERIDDKLRKE